ncbi:hypothetical protein CCMSSC00406_0006960 [Pleurotus cornucopiae]|uniref:Uncharacterized protein n=1 Tax=Pleurotus cornucopiae TaxID=5321 RepID=A0ACB7J1M7_PLECO|nr:hypothetical protein CCMSSC00406_0006960 [Pleurotus cornucopiae]
MAISVGVDKFGRPSGRTGPVGLLSYKEPTHPLLVKLIICPPHTDGHTRPLNTQLNRSAHWMLAWDIGFTGSGNVAQRRFQIIPEELPTGEDHLTNWGGLIVADNPEDHPERIYISIKDKMTFSQRQVLGEIADGMPVRRPGSGWNGQDWCLEVLAEASKRGILEDEELRRVAQLALSPSLIARL